MPSENDTKSVDGASTDRRTRKRDARRDHLLDLAADLVEAHGVAGVTMAALAEAADYAPASLYTYFPSRSALLAALQRRALTSLSQVADEHLAQWDEYIEDTPRISAEVAALARLFAFSDLFLAAPERFPREFRLQQQLLVTPGVEDDSDAASVVPAAMLVLDAPRRLLAAAVEVGALAEHRHVDDPIDQPVDGAVARTLAWVVALNGALLVDGLTTGLATTGVRIGAELTDSLLRGWGAHPATVDRARALVDTWEI